ncbi:MAG: hypothetical protein ACK5OX_13030 [Desertimonas sp.]
MNRFAVLAVSTGTVVFVIVALLLVLAATMVGLAVWLIRRTRRDAPALGPLEVMTGRAWRRGDEIRRDEILTSARPDGARAPAPMIDGPDAPDAPDGPDGPDEYDRDDG